MKMNDSVLKRLSLVAGAVVCCALNFPAKTAPTITTQPASQTNVPGTDVTFTVAVAGTGPFSYQWQINGADHPTNIITTLAGNGPSSGITGGGGYTGDGLAAPNASLNYPCGVALDASGNLYIADSYNFRIRKVDLNGIITTVAGSAAGYSGDGGLATGADLRYPSGVAVDAAGNIYIADRGNNRIRRVDTNGIITTIAGNGSATYAGDGGLATNASLNTPYGVAVDASGNLYIADYGNQRIREVTPAGIIATVAGTNIAGYSGDGGAATSADLHNPAGVDVDATGNLYIADYSNNRIRKVDIYGVITTVAGGGSGGDGDAATNASLSGPAGVALDAAGNLYVADTGHHKIREVDTNGNITTVAGNGSGNYAGDGGAPTNASLHGPRGVVSDTVGNLYIADALNNRIRKAVPPGSPTLSLPDVSAGNAANYTVVISSPSGSVTSAVATLTVEAPPVITIQPASQIAVAGNSPVFSVVVVGSGPFGYLWDIGGTNLVQSSPNSTLTLPGVSANDAGNYTVVATNAYGGVTSQVATLTVAFPPSVVTQPSGLAVLAGSHASLSVTVGGTGRFSYQWQFNGANLPNNLITTAVGGGNKGDRGAATNARLIPAGVVLDVSGDLYVSDTYYESIRKVDTNGIISTIAGNGSADFSGDGGAATNATLNYPDGMAFDAAGNCILPT